jgi:peptidoglycan-associated lipoprotein
MRRTSYMSTLVTLALLALIISAGGCKKKTPPQPPPGTSGKTGPGPDLGPTNLAQPKISLSASPNPIYMGQSTTLSWESENATGVSINNGIGTVEASGSRSVSPRESVTYKATATGADGSSATHEVRVTVTMPPAEVDKQPPIGINKILDILRADLKDVFFDYDQYSIREDARNTLIEDARLLTKYPRFRITIEGHCDERGSEKYNLALGDRRAVAAKDFLAAQGVDGIRIDTISYGKEMPFCEESNEQCYQLNRRAHFTVDQYEGE